MKVVYQRERSHDPADIAVETIEETENGIKLYKGENPQQRSMVGFIPFDHLLYVIPDEA